MTTNSGSTEGASTRTPFQTLVEGAPDGIVISRDGIVLYANRAALTLLGYDDLSELINQPMASFLDGASLATMRRRIQQMIATGDPPVPREYPAKRRDGTTVTAEISSIIIEFEGKPAVLAYARDVTERARLRAQVAHNDRLAALGIMAAGIAHEINNPLAFVMLAADMLERRYGEAGGERGELVSNIHTGVQRIAAIVRELRTFGQYEDEPVSAIDLHAAFDSAERIAAHELRPRVSVLRKYGDLPAVFGSRRRLEQVFVNLLLNAAHAIPEERLDGEITVRGGVEGDQVVFEIRDNGEGIDADLLPRIFEPFFTTKPASAGTGLGLSICRDIITRLGGTIVASSVRGQGTTMRMTLPRYRETGMASIPIPRQRPANSTERRRVLVIDDEPLIVQMVADALRDQHDVVGETNPKQGLQRLLKDPTFDVVMCDLMMPGITGMDLYAEVAREHPGLERRFVFVTAGAYTARARQFLDEVPNPRLLKPLSANQLESLVRQVE